MIKTISITVATSLITGVIGYYGALKMAKENKIMDYREKLLEALRALREEIRTDPFAQKDIARFENDVRDYSVLLVNGRWNLFHYFSNRKLEKVIADIRSCLEDHCRGRRWRPAFQELAIERIDMAIAFIAKI